MKKVTGKIVACVAAIAVMAGILCSCAPLYNRVGEMIRSVARVREHAKH